MSVGEWVFWSFAVIVGVLAFVAVFRALGDGDL